MAARGQLALTLTILAVSLVAAGCGGSSEGATSAATKGTSSGTSSQNELSFAEQANAICRGAESEREKAVTDATEEGKAPDQKSLVTKVIVPQVQTMIEELKGLTPPKGDEKEVGAIITAFEGGVAKLKANPSDYADNLAAFAKADRLAEEYELIDCGL
jgi:hypothetical protein